jgi:hypothetical protein
MTAALMAGLFSGGGLYALLGIVWLILMISLGITSIRKGHWVMFIIGLFFPLFWIIGALLPPKRKYDVG